MTRFTNEEKKFMRIAIEEAIKARNKGDLPIGAVLVINGKLVDKNRNKLFSEKNWSSHAESSLIRKNSTRIKNSKKISKSKIELYTTLEPCLMCLGYSLLHRIDKIVYSCRDPNGGACSIDVKSLTPWYERKWPKIKKGLYEKETLKLMQEYLSKKKTKGLQDLYKVFKKIK